jgi:site-specific recombinase XerD
MKTSFNLAVGKLAAFQTGTLAAHMSGYADLLERDGYAMEYGYGKLRQLRDFSRWLQRRHLGVTDINEELVAAFRSRRCIKRHGFGEGATLTLLLKYLRNLNAIPSSGPVPASSPIDSVIEEYRKHQVIERCLGEPTVAGYCAAIRRFLLEVSADGGCDFNKLTAAQINQFVIKETTRLGRKACQLSTSSIRSFLRFLLMTGRLDRDLTSAVPTVAGWPASELPHYLEPGDVRKLLASCDRKTDNGKRNYAILLLLARLGLRAGEVSRLELSDIDWNASEIRINGKHGRVDRLPLPQDVGKAVVEYLKCRHAESSSKRLFLHTHAPYMGLEATPPNSVSSIVRRGLKRAHLNPPHKGAHILRHSLATRMLGRGVSIFQIGQVLRHATIQTTEIYAKVDLTSLRKLAQPWPGGAS